MQKCPFLYRVISITSACILFKNPTFFHVRYRTSICRYTCTLLPFLSQHVQTVTNQSEQVIPNCCPFHRLHGCQLLCDLTVIPRKKISGVTYITALIQSQRKAVKFGRSVLQLKFEVSCDVLNPPRYSTSGG